MNKTNNKNKVKLNPISKRTNKNVLMNSLIKENNNNFFLTLRKKRINT
jgi:hypothetical protein